MRAVIVYESLYGNTHAVAEQIGEGMRSRYETTVVSVGEATPEVLADADFLLVGGPTHSHGMSRESTRKAAMSDTTVASMDMHAGGPGLREWLDTLSNGHVHAAVAFDTRADAPVLITGRASKGINKRLADHGYWMVTEPESFLVDRHHRLLGGELDRARAWGEELASVLAATPQG